MSNTAACRERCTPEGSTWVLIFPEYCFSKQAENVQKIICDCIATNQPSSNVSYAAMFAARYWLSKHIRLFDCTRTIEFSVHSLLCISIVAKLQRKSKRKSNLIHHLHKNSVQNCGHKLFQPLAFITPSLSPNQFKKKTVTQSVKQFPARKRVNSSAWRSTSVTEPDTTVIVYPPKNILFQPATPWVYPERDTNIFNDVNFMSSQK